MRGDAETLREKLLYNATINQVSLSDQIFLRRRLYEKYLGCDLYYIYCDTKDNIQFDILTRAENPSGNLLNCGTADTAVIESDDIKLLSNIGLFFKPDKMGILKINVDNFSWEIDKSKLSEDTFYIFPDPNKYGDIGNNKSLDYPLIYEYKLDSYIKNISSGYSKDDPLAYISTTTWNTYYSEQDKNFILNENRDYNYSFTALANRGIITDYQKDIYGNEFGLLKGLRITEDTIYVPSKFPLPELKYLPGGDETDRNSLYNVLFNGGYFKDPRMVSTLLKFPEDTYIRIANDYIWTTIKLNGGTFLAPDECASCHLNMGTFNDRITVQYVDHFNNVPTFKTSINKSKKYTSEVVFNNFTSKLATLMDKKIVKEDKDYYDLFKEEGMLFVKENGKNIIEFKPAFKTYEKVNENFENKIKRYAIINDILILETKTKIFFFEEDISNGLNFYEIESIDIEDDCSYKVLYNEKKEQFIIAILKQNRINDNNYNSLSLLVHQFDITSKKLKKNIINTEEDTAENNEWQQWNDNFNYVQPHGFIEDFVLTYNSNLDLYLLAYLLNNNLSPYLYQHQFKIFNKHKFYNSLKSEVFYEKNIADTNFKYIINPTIDTPLFEDGELFFNQVESI